MTIASQAFKGATIAKTNNLLAVLKLATVSAKDFAFQEADFSVSGITDFSGIKLPAGACMNAKFKDAVTIKVDGNLQEKVFKGCTTIKTVTASNLTSIGESAFEGCTGLNTVTLSGDDASLKTIGAFAFKNCTALTGATLNGNAFVSIGESAFEGCTVLKTVTLGGDYTNFTTVAKNAFSGCTALTNFGYKLMNTLYFLPSKLKTIGEGAFKGCASLTKANFIFLQNSDGKITSVGASAFEGCATLDNAVFANLFNTSYDGEGLSFDGVKFGEASFKGCSLIGTMDLSNVNSTMTSVPASAFEGNSGITGVKYPTACAEVGANAFKDCAIAEISLPEGLTKVGGSAFFAKTGPYSQKELYLPASLRSIGQDAFGVADEGCRTITTIYANPGVTAPNSIPTIDATQTSLKIGKVVVPVIDPYVVGSENKTLKDAYSAWKFDETTFEFASASASGGCYTYDNVEYTLGTQDDYGFYPLIPTSYVAATPTVYGVFDNTVSEFADLKSVGTEKGKASLYKLYCYVTAPTYQMNVAEGIKVTGITFDVVPTGARELTYAKDNMNKEVVANFAPAVSETTPATLKTVTINDSYTKVGDNAFAGQTLLATVKLPLSLETIGNSAFKGCTSLGTAWSWIEKETKEKTSKLSKIDANAFAGCTKLTKISLPASLEAIGDNAFDGDDKLNAITLPENLASVGKSAFAGTGITSITLPKSLQTISSLAFSTVKYEVLVSYTTIPNLPIDAFAYKVKKEATDTEDAEYDKNHFAATLVVDGDRSAYTSKSNWKKFFVATGKFTVTKNGVSETVCENEDGIIVFEDAVEAVSVTGTINNAHVSYTRSFAGKEYWQPISLPFAVTAKQLTKAGLEAAELYNIRLDDETGALEAVVWIKLKGEDAVMKANTPYVVRPLDRAGSKTITAEGVTIEKTTTPGTVDCSSTKELYTLTSNFKNTDMLAAKGYYLAPDTEKKCTVFSWATATYSLSPYRFYLTRMNRADDTLIYESWTKEETSSVKVVVLDDEEEAATYINSLSVRDAENLNAPMYDITGRQIVSPVKGQVYIQNGVKKLAK